ncbi:hypothetical protein AGABI2DRAFT_70494, partial [Agaricus bisporus var. bisporus H97]|uniref:hypothetical protein n=1 Tax=Agaricus bisporus var. bisporus (strain H97 / ATCC MYA-4626 / FGSC 10389) TaxID=936046 RepID=UPI00029F5F73
RAGEVKENGNEAFKAGKYQEAIDLYTEAIHLDPTEPLYLTNRAAAYMGLKRFRPALEDCQQAATLQQASPQPKTLLRLARCQLMLGLLVAAASTAKEILTIDAYNPQALELQEKIRTLKTQVKNSKNAKSRKEWDLAKSTLDECFRAIKGEVPTEWRLWEVEIALARRDWEKADTAVNEALRINLNSPDVLALRGLVLFLSGKMGPAKKHVTHALRLDPSCEPAMKLRKRVMDVERLEEEGNAAFRSRQLLEALEKYSRALERIGKAEEEGGGGHIRATLLSTRAAAFFELAHFGEALNDATSALELSPKSVQLLRARARIYLHLQRFDSCVADFKSAVKQAEGQGTDAEIQGLRLELMKAVAAWNRSRGKNYYDTLGVEMDSNESDIKAAYDREAWRCHPNRGGDIKRYRQVVEAYEVISDPQRRVRYDMGEIEGGVNDDGSFVVRVVVEG